MAQLVPISILFYLDMNGINSSLHMQAGGSVPSLTLCLDAHFIRFFAVSSTHIVFLVPVSLGRSLTLFRGVAPFEGIASVTQTLLNASCVPRTWLGSDMQQ